MKEDTSHLHQKHLYNIIAITLNLGPCPQTNVTTMIPQVLVIPYSRLCLNEYISVVLVIDDCFSLVLV